MLNDLQVEEIKQLLTDEQFETWLNSLGDAEAVGAPDACPIRYYLAKNTGPIGRISVGYGYVNLYSNSPKCDEIVWVKGALGQLPRQVDIYVREQRSTELMPEEEYDSLLDKGWGIVTVQVLRDIWTSLRKVYGSNESAD